MKSTMRERLSDRLEHLEIRITSFSLKRRRGQRELRGLQFLS